jgi:uncharacterized protein (DUF924 family)
LQQITSAEGYAFNSRDDDMFQEVLKFWFEEAKPSQWWTKDEEFDQLISRRFSAVHSRAKRCELFEWRETAEGRLAEIIVLDQFSRNMYRGSALAFAQDPMALVLAQEAVSRGIDRLLTPVQRGFVYLPFMHSESIKIHEAAEIIYRQHGVQSSLEWELKHKVIIERFGRYPHRNEILGRESTDEERAFLTQPNSSF